MISVCSFLGEKWAWQQTPLFPPPGGGNPMSLFIRVATVEDKKPAEKMKSKIFRTKKRTVTVASTDGNVESVQVLETKVDLSGRQRMGSRGGNRHQQRHRRSQNNGIAKRKQ